MRNIGSLVPGSPVNSTAATLPITKPSNVENGLLLMAKSGDLKEIFRANESRECDHQFKT